MHPKRRVVITGLGVCSSIGIGIERFWNSLLKPVSGISATPDEFSFLPCRVAGIIGSEECMSAKEQTQHRVAASNTSIDWRSLSRAAAFGIVAACEALTQAGWKQDGLKHSPNTRSGIHFGVGMEGIQEIVDTSEAINSKKYKGIGPHALTRSLANMPAGAISRLWQLRGPCMAGNTACATGLHSIGDAYRMIQYGEADLMVAGGCEATVNPWAIAAFSRIRALTTRFNETPVEASRPFDALRDGFAMSEGAACMVLQVWPPTADMASHFQPNSPPIAEIIGFGRSADAHNLVAPDPIGDGALRSMQAALQDAQLDSLDQIDHINCHATSTPLGDTIELAAICRLLASHNASHDRPNPIIVNSIKGHTGHLLGAAGAIESVYTALAVNRNIAVSNCNLHSPISASELERVLSANSESANSKEALDAFEKRVRLPKHKEPSVPLRNSSITCRRVALTNSFGFGGTNGTLVIAEWKE
ncbi:3-oxoacyl-[ACP] synthase [Clonorchis sinensis]|uniref:beta-ketoacyl-[acyl-carrier-protein] synthase I n=1 Tax=Clonorchis sinensis TaxID=79923 RepID=H2KTM0_CLOSI|nr:3-oxoacyl-[ACP] synthase [Clonorchis sinensis]